MGVKGKEILPIEKKIEKSKNLTKRKNVTIRESIPMTQKESEKRELEKRKNVTIRESICHDRQRKNLRKSFLMTEKAFVMIYVAEYETPMSSNSMAQLPSIQSSSTSTPPNG